MTDAVVLTRRGIFVLFVFCLAVAIAPGIENVKEIPRRPKESMSTEEIMPNPKFDIVAETSVIASVVSASEQMTDELVAMLDPEDFYALPHRYIWQAVSELRAERVCPDLPAIAVRLKTAKRLDDVGGLTELARVCLDTEPATTCLYVARRIRKLARVRRTQAVMRRYATAELEGDVDTWLEQAVREVVTVAAPDAETNFEWYPELMHGVADDIRSYAKTADNERGISTGIQMLDSTLRGFRPGWNVVIAGRPGQGKTAFAGGIVEQSAANGYAWLIFSLEMTTVELRDRSLTRHSGISGDVLDSGALSAVQWSDIASAITKCARMPIAVDATAGLTPAVLRSKVQKWALDVRRRHPKAKLGGFVVDHLQLTSGSDTRRTLNEQRAEFSRQAKELAKTHGCVAMLLSQLNRPEKTGGVPKRPQMNDLRDSGAIEQDADVILFVHRPSEYEPGQRRWPDTTAEVIMAKGRSRSTGLYKVQYDGPTTRFFDIVCYDNPSFDPEFDNEGFR